MDLIVFLVILATFFGVVLGLAFAFILIKIKNKALKKNAPKQIEKQHAITQQEILALRKEFQAQVQTLHKEVQQVQNNLTQDIAALKKEMRELSASK